MLMRHLLFKLLIISILVYSSCSNNSDTITADSVHFHGRIMTFCDSLIPVPHTEVNFHRAYDNGISRSNYLGSTYTNIEGYYSFITEVPSEEVFDAYILNIYPENTIMNRQYVAHEESFNDLKNVEINAFAFPGSAYGFHIKNINSFDSNDKFNSLTAYFIDNAGYAHPIITNLISPNVDTIIYRFFSPYHSVSYDYSYTKNGILTTIPIDSLVNQNCLETLTVEVFY